MTTLGFVACNLSIQQRLVSASLGSAFTLIEDLCGPLEDDSVANSAELKRRAEQVAILTEYEWRDDPDRDPFHRYLNQAAATLRETGTAE